jgi:hypothetical protein
MFSINLRAVEYHSAVKRLATDVSKLSLEFASSAVIIRKPSVAIIQ